MIRHSSRQIGYEPLSVMSVLSKKAVSFDRVISSAAHSINIAGVAVLALMMLLTATDVCLRYIFNSPITGAYELTEFLMAIVVAFGLAYTAIKKEHISIDLVISRLPQRTQTVINSTTCFFSVCVFALITWRSILYAEKLRIGEYASQSLLIPVYPFVYVVAFGSAVFCLVLLCDLRGYLRQLIEGEPWRVWLPLIFVILLVILLFSTPIFKEMFPWRVGPSAAGIIGLVLLVVLIFLGMPIGIIMGLVGFLGMTYISGLKPGLNIMGTTPHTTASSYGLSVVPLFILMGTFCYHSGLGKEVYYAVHRWLGHLPGGLAMATVGACALFAAVSGSSLATAATMGMVALPEMKRYKYDSALATGSIAAGGSIGILIPPSVILVIYAILTEQSIGKLFMAGFIPGILEAFFYIATIYILCKRNPLLGPKGPKSNYREKIVAFKAAWGVIVLFALVIGGIYLGVFTPTEAAGVGAFGALVFSIARRALSWGKFKESLYETGKNTAMIFVILIGAMLLGYFLAVSRLPFALSTFVSEMQVNRYIVLALIIFLYLIMGAIMSSLAMVVLTVPILFPVVQTLGFDPIWFGIIIVRVVEVGQITPPMGINVFIIKGVAKDVPLETVFKGIVPFLIADICHIALLMAVPQLATFLPGLMK